MTIHTTTQVRSQPIETRAAARLPYDTFVRDYMRQRRPVVIRGAVSRWTALRKWTPEFFKTRFQSKRVQVSYQDSMTFGEFIDGILASTHALPGPYMYRLFIHEHLPEILADLQPQNEYAFPRRFASPLMRTFWRRPDGYLKLLIGGIGGRFPVLHYDGENAHATVTEIYGDKEFVMYPPSDGAYLYPDPALPNKSRVIDPHVIDLERFPLQAKATQYRAVLEPGDMVFIPCKWWHTARALSPSISVGLNILDASNWDGFVADITRPLALPLQPSPVFNRVYWKTLGPLLTAIERVQKRFPMLACLAPNSREVVPDPSTMKFKIHKREG
jgi:cupin-like protein